MTTDRNIAQEARQRAEHAQLMRRWKRPAELPEQIMSPLFPRSRSVPTSQQWPLDDAERDLPTSTESDLADANVLARQALAAPELDDTDRRILRAIIEGDSHMTVVEIAAEADISRANLPGLPLDVLEAGALTTTNPAFGDDELARLIPDVRAYVSRRLRGSATVDDVVSITLEKATRYARSYDPEKGSLGAWVMTIAKNEIASLRPSREIPTAEVDPAGRDDPYADADFRIDFQRFLNQAALDDLDRRILVLTATGRDQATTARILQVHPKQVERRLTRFGRKFDVATWPPTR